MTWSFWASGLQGGNRVVSRWVDGGVSSRAHAFLLKVTLLKVPFTHHGVDIFSTFYRLFFLLLSCLIFVFRSLLHSPLIVSPHWLSWGGHGSLQSPSTCSPALPQSPAHLVAIYSGHWSTKILPLLSILHYFLADPSIVVHWSQPFHFFFELSYVIFFFNILLQEISFLVCVFVCLCVVFFPWKKHFLGSVSRVICFVICCLTVSK